MAGVVVHDSVRRQQRRMESEQTKLRPASLAEAQEELSRSLLASNEYSLVRVLADGGRPLLLTC